MATITAGPDIERLQIGRVFARATGAIGRNLVLFLGIAFVFGVASRLVNYGFARNAVQVGGFALFRSPAYWLGILWSFVSGFLLYAALVHATVLDLSGIKPRIGPVLAVALRSLLPLIGLAIVSYFAAVFAGILFVIPALLLLVRWSVAVPVLVEERAGVFGSLKRSNALTRGSRWRVFALFLIVFLVIIIPSLITFAAVGLTGAVQIGATLTPMFFLLAVIGALVNMFALAILASCYVELRYVKDGIAPDRLAQVFA